MVRLVTRFACAAVLTAGVSFTAPSVLAQVASPLATSAQAAPPATSPATKTRSRGRKPAVEEAPQAPAPPPTLEQSPPTAPRVSMQNGLLLIDAHNATLSQVLRAVQQQTGASMDVPGSANGERVVAQIGPGRPQDVLTTLLNGSKFDYVILGVLGSPGAVQKVILTPRQPGAAASMAAQNNAPPPPQPAEDISPDEGAVADNGEPDYQNEQNNPYPNTYQNPTTGQVVATPGGFRRPGVPNQSPEDNSDPGYVGPGGEAQGGKSPEELMQELQQLQQQQQIYQQQLNPANQNPPVQ